MKYVFPAVITKEDDSYLVVFPDISNCFTSGRTLHETLIMGEDVLNVMLVHMEDGREDIPSPSGSIEALKCQDGDIVTLVPADTTEYRRLWSDKLIKRTVRIQRWMSSFADRAGLDLSQLLQDALLRKIYED